MLIKGFSGWLEEESGFGGFGGFYEVGGQERAEMAWWKLHRLHNTA